MDCNFCVHNDDKSYHIHAVQKEVLPGSISTKPISEKVKFVPNALGGRIWADTEIYWKRESSYPWIEDKLLDELTKAALLEASILTPLKIKQRNRKMSDAQIIINWLGKKDEPYFTSPSILALGWGPGFGLGGNITMNADVLWLLRKTPLYAKEAKELGYIENFVDPKNKVKFYDPVHTKKHEGGHALGMNHITDLRFAKTDIMYPIYNGVRKFGAQDISYLQELYGKASVNKRIMDTLTTRIHNF